MAKRFIDTDFFKSPFVRGLEAPLKMLYCFIICDCNGAGIWVADFEIASLYLGMKIDQKMAEKFLQTGKAVDLGDGKWFIPDFIDHQYPSGLQAGNPAHKNFIGELQKYQLLDGALKPLRRPFEGSKVMVKVKVKDKVMVKDKVKKPVEIILPYQTESFAKAWELWKKYRSEQHRFVYKPLSEQAALVALKRMSNDEAHAIAIIHQSIEKSWKGLFQLSNTNQNAGQRKTGVNSDQELAEALARRHGIAE